ncbi:nuclear transport factor 2 family protein [Mycolicibacterium sp. XJ1819]
MAAQQDKSLEARLRYVEDMLAIGQLPIRYALAVDDRDVDGWVGLFVPDVRVGDAVGRDALREQITPLLRQFYRSIHQIVGHRVDIVDEHHATGSVYCRAEHEVGDRWVVMAIRYDDEYRKVDDEWLFHRRKEKHWYAADLTESPQQVGFEGWELAGRPNLPRSASWNAFWDSVDASPVTDSPIT